LSTDCDFGLLPEFCNVRLRAGGKGWDAARQDEKRAKGKHLPGRKSHSVLPLSIWEVDEVAEIYDGINPLVVSAGGKSKAQAVSIFLALQPKGHSVVSFTSDRLAVISCST